MSEADADATVIDFGPWRAEPNEAGNPIGVASSVSSTEISACYLGAIERAAVSPSVTMLGKLAGGLGVTAVELVMDVPPKAEPKSA